MGKLLLITIMLWVAIVWLMCGSPMPEANNYRSYDSSPITMPDPYYTYDDGAL